MPHLLVNTCVCVCVCVSSLYLFMYKSVCLSVTDEPAFKQISSRRLSAEDFSVEKVIGRGAFGEVQLVRTLLAVVHVSNSLHVHVHAPLNKRTLSLFLLSPLSLFFSLPRYPPTPFLNFKKIPGSNEGKQQSVCHETSLQV